MYKEIENYKMDVIPTSSSLLLTYKLQKGISDQSYGLFIAKMAGLPDSIIKQAEKIIAEKKGGKKM